MDPVTVSALLSTLGSVGGQVASNIESKKREAEYEAKKQREQKKWDVARDRIANIDFSPGSGIYELQQQRELQAELLGSEAARRGDEREARALAALQDSPRQMQALAPRIISQSEDALQKADLQVGQMKADALKPTVAAEQKAEDEARKRDMMLDQLDLSRAGKAFDTYQEGAYGERAARVEGNRALLSELAETGVAVGGNLATIKASENALKAAQDARDAELLKYKSLFGGDSTDQTGETTVTNSGYNLDFGQPEVNTYSPAGEGYNLDFGQPEEDTFSPDDTVLPEGDPSFDPYDVIYGRNGMLIGKDGGITEGEFSHKTNKKAVIDQENGIKEAELTGGEGILNPKQFKNLQSVKDLLDKLAAMPSAPAEIKKAAELLSFLEGEQFQDA